MLILKSRKRILVEAEQRNPMVRSQRAGSLLGTKLRLLSASEANSALVEESHDPLSVSGNSSEVQPDTALSEENLQEL